MCAPCVRAVPEPRQTLFQASRRAFTTPVIQSRSTHITSLNSWRVPAVSHKSLMDSALATLKPAQLNLTRVIITHMQHSLPTSRVSAAKPSTSTPTPLSASQPAIHLLPWKGASISHTHPHTLYHTTTCTCNHRCCVVDVSHRQQRSR